MTPETLLVVPPTMIFPLDNLIPEIIDRVNMDTSFDYVVSHLENAGQRDNMRPKKKAYVERLIREIGNGTFRIGPEDFRTLEVTDGPKKRIVQCPTYSQLASAKLAI